MTRIALALLWAVAMAMPAAAQQPKRVSILGDSYSTFAGWLTPDTNLVWYDATEANRKRTDVMSVEHTWWHQLISIKGWQLEVNNSYSGSTVCNTGYRGDDYTHESFVTRSSCLGSPDIILVFGGTNDSWAGSPIGQYQYGGWTRADLYQFRPAMACLLDTLQKMYPRAEIHVISNDGLKPQITESMATICHHYGVNIIQLTDISKQHGHPNQAGMSSIARQVAKGVDAPRLPRVQVAPHWGDRRATITYTFDDGLLEHYTMVFPQLRKRGMRATFGIIGSKVGRDMKGTPCMSWQHISEMAANGQDMANHGWEHRNVTTLDSATLSREIAMADSAMTLAIGHRPATYIYPGNRITPQAAQQCEQGRVGGRHRQVSLGSKRDAKWMRQWVGQLIDNGAWGIAMTHGITTGYDALGDPTPLWQHFDHVCSLSDSIWVATLADATAYAAERQTVSLAIDATAHGMDITPSMPLDNAIYRHPLTLCIHTQRPLEATQQGRHST